MKGRLPFNHTPFSKEIEKTLLHHPFSIDDNHGQVGKAQTSGIVSSSDLWVSGDREITFQSRSICKGSTPNVTASINLSQFCPGDTGEMSIPVEYHAARKDLFEAVALKYPFGPSLYRPTSSNFIFSDTSRKEYISAA
ncbi:hypothetical protein AVEN_115022-1 [Araneus ventricosus]|uniref:Uncharacterized protein n=1 Tax=Araneus ventricosus TaxID=182803 RepID=A0A4Y1ZWW3_ARAVE|nr:hypothetical protein AVEN_115022-1 [Araneus ventricosus]